MIKPLIFLVALAAVLLFIRWRIQAATRKLLAQTLPDVNLGLPLHPNGVILLFHPPACKPCQQAVEQVDQLATQHPGQTLKINVAESLELARAFGIRATPTLLFIKDNAIHAAFIGAISQHKLQALLKS